MQFNDTLSIVTEYVSRGFSLFLCHSIDENGNCTCGKADCKDAGKHPIWDICPNGVKNATSDLATLTVWLDQYPNANIALATGEASGVIVVDDDDVEANAQMFSTLSKTFQTKSGRGFHHYFRWKPEYSILKNTSLKEKGFPKIDIKGNGGYVILPPSIHQTGVQYEIVNDIDPAEMPEWLFNLCPKRDQVETHFSRGATEMNVQASPKGDMEIETISAKPDSFIRAVEYLKKCPPAISGDGGSNQTYKTVCRLIELVGNDLTDEQILESLDSWNSTCSPPWSPSELRHKVQDARKTVKRKMTIGDMPDEHFANTSILQDVESTDVETIHSDADSHAPRANNVSPDASGDGFPVLHPDALIGLAGDIVNTIDPETEADPAGILISLLTIFGNAVGNRPHASVGADIHCGNIFACLVGDTASAKGQATNIVKYILPAEIRADIAYGMSSGEGLIERISDPDPEDEEGEFGIFPLRKLICIESEFARPITAMRREGNTLSPILRSAWDRQPLEIMTRGKSKLKASNAYVSILANITPDELKKILGSSVELLNGFANRFLWAFVRSTKSLPDGGNIHVLDSFKEKFADAIEQAKLIRTVKRSDDASRLWKNVYDDLKETTGIVAERARPQVLRLSLIYALLDGSSTIEEKHLKAALAVWRYCESSAKMLFADVKSNPNTNITLEDRVRQFVWANPGSTKTNIWSAISKRIKGNVIDDALENLVFAGQILAVHDGRTNRYYSPSDSPSNAGGMRNRGNQDSAGTSADSPIPPSPDSPSSFRGESDSVIPRFPNSPDEKEGIMPIDELIMWSNVNSIDFVRLPDGSVWVAQPEPLPASIERAIKENQSILARFVVGEQEGTVHSAASGRMNDDDNESEFLQALVEPKVGLSVSGSSIVKQFQNVQFDDGKSIRFENPPNVCDPMDDEEKAFFQEMHDALQPLS